MSLHLTLLTPHAATPAYLLTCTRTLHRTVVDPTVPADVEDALGQQPLDLILLTTATTATLAAARALHLRTGAPVLAGITTANAAKAANLPVARGLADGEVVGLGPLAQTLALPAPLPEDGEETTPGPYPLNDIMAFAIGSVGLLFTGPLFAEAPRRPLPAIFHGIPTDWLVLGGHAAEATAENAPTLGSLLR